MNEAVILARTHPSRSRSRTQQSRSRSQTSKAKQGLKPQGQGRGLKPQGQGRGLKPKGQGQGHNPQVNVQVLTIDCDWNLHTVQQNVYITLKTLRSIHFAETCTATKQLNLTSIDIWEMNS